MTVVSNTTPLIGLASIGRFDLLREVFGRVIIPRAVFHEAVTAGREQGGAKREVESAEWISVADVQDRLAVAVLLDELDLGEAETIVLAGELNATWVLMDERKGRRKLEQLELPVIGTLGILLRAKNAGLITTLSPELERLRAQGFSISQAVVDAALTRAGEIPAV